MAKAHEPEHTSQRTLTPEEQARRKATMEGGDPLKQVRPLPPAGGQTSDYGGPVDNYERRLQRAAVAPGPGAVDYDRDGYPDSIMGRSGRNYNQRREHANFRSGTAGQTVNPVPGARNANFGKVSDLSRDGYRQDQMGYRDRFRVRIEAANHLAEGIEDPDQNADPRLVSVAQKGVPSHGGTGVPGGSPTSSGFYSGRARFPTARALGPPASGQTTPLEQAVMAPRTPATGFENTGAQRHAHKSPVRTEEGGIPGPGGNPRQASYGNVPVQGVFDPEAGTFVVGTQPEATPPDSKNLAQKHEPAKHEPAKHEPHKTEPAKPHDHGKAHDHGKK